MAMSMALAPSDLFHESLNIIQTIADSISTIHPNILLFMSYMRSTWLPIASKVSVYNCRIRTNNITESFHHIITQKIGTVNPNLWIFFGKCISYKFYIFLYFLFYIIFCNIYNTS